MPNTKQRSKSIKKSKPGKQIITPVIEAHRQAEQDIEADPDLKTTPSVEDDLDEGELARLEGEK